MTAVAVARVAEEDAVVDVGLGAAVAAGKMKDVDNMHQQELRAIAKSLGVKLREAGKDGKETKFRGVAALKEACKVAQSRLCQASPENAQERSAPKAGVVNKRKDVDNMQVEDVLQYGKSSREYLRWYKRQWKCKRRTAADRGEAVAVAALLKDRKRARDHRRNIQMPGAAVAAQPCPPDILQQLRQLRQSEPVAPAPRPLAPATV